MTSMRSVWLNVLCIEIYILFIRYLTVEPFNCDQCNKSFRGKNNLVIHQRIHNGESLSNVSVWYFSNSNISSYQSSFFKSFYQSSDTQWGNDFQYDHCGKTNYTSKCTYHLSENIKWGKLFKCDQCNIFYSKISPYQSSVHTKWYK